jgi:hypothetical protein
LAFLKGVTAQIAQVLSAAIGKPDAEDWPLSEEGYTDGWHWMLKAARERSCGRACSRLPDSNSTSAADA